MDNPNVDVSIVLPILKQIPLFAGLEENLHREIISRIVLMYYPKDYVLFKEGETGDALYIVKNGMVEIFHPAKEEGDLPKKVAELATGSFFGEMALVSNAPRNASAKTLADSEIFILSKNDLQNLMNTNTVLAEHISRAMIDRLKANDSQNS